MGGNKECRTHEVRNEEDRGRRGNGGKTGTVAQRYSAISVLTRRGIKKLNALPLSHAATT